MKRVLKSAFKALVAWFLIGLLWLLHFLPMGLLVPLGEGLGALLWRLAVSRREIALRNIALCFPDKTEEQVQALAREHFTWMGRSLLERGLLWYSSAERLKGLIRIKGNIKLAEQTEQPFMWLLPHFAGLEWVGPGLMLHQARPGIEMHSEQSNPTLDRALLRGRSRFGTTVFFSRNEGIRPVLRFIKQGYAFLSAPDLDHGIKDAEFIPFFNIPTCTLTAPARLASTMGMVAQPLVVTMLPGTQGYEVEACEPIEGFPSGDAVADTRRFNQWLEERIRRNPAQYFWVHKRFKTRPPGEPSLYG